MPRQPRRDAPGTSHHVAVRGIERCLIFVDDADRSDLTTRLARILPESGVRCFGWALMPNHFHLVIQTGQVSISRVMARLNTGYARHFNQRHARCGHVFQNRFFSRTIADDSELLGVIRYVHLNPLRAALVRSMRDLELHRWCGHGALVGRVPALSFHSVEAVLALFGQDEICSTERVKLWMSTSDASGSDRWASSRENSSGRKPAGPPIPLAAGRSRRTATDLDELVAKVCAHLGVDARKLREGRRSEKIAKARAVISYRAVVEQGFSGSEVGRCLGVTRAAVSRVIDRGRGLVFDGRTEPQRVDKLTNVPARRVGGG